MKEVQEQKMLRVVYLILFYILLALAVTLTVMKLTRQRRTERNYDYEILYHSIELL